MIFFKIFSLGLLVLYGYGMGQTPSYELNGFGKFIAYSFFITAPLLYFFPTVEAFRNSKSDRLRIALVNVFLGWTLLGWVIALIWSSKKDEPIAVEVQPVQTPPVASAATHSNVAADLERLANLLDRGLLSKDEFDEQKRRLLGA